MSYAEALAAQPEEAVRRTIRGMLPKGRLGRSMARKLKIYAGPAHPHAAQQPEALDLAHARARELTRRPTPTEPPQNQEARRCLNPSARRPAAARKPSPACACVRAPA